MVEAQPRPFSWSPKVCFTATNLLDESELLTGWEVLAIKNRMREVQASARATKARAVVGLAGDQSSFSEEITCTFIS